MSVPKNLQWIKVPKRYRVTRVENNRYDLESTLPLALEFGKITDLGPGLRVESKGWGTGAYRVYRISTEPLGNSLNYEPELVHIPAGEFLMSEQETDREAYRDTKPLHSVHLNEYWIGRYPVTVYQFAFFVEHYGYTTTEEEYYHHDTHIWRVPRRGSTETQDRGRHPVTWVSLRDAQAYCRWLSEVTGKTYDLPTQGQWEKAERGTDETKYPWGNSEPNRTLCNIENWFGGTTPVGQFSPDGDGPKFDNPYGCVDMIGNVSEWTRDSYTHTFMVYPDCDPDFGEEKTRTYYVACGTSWRMSRQSRSNSHRYGHASDDVGFRVVTHPFTNLDFASK